MNPLRQDDPRHVKAVEAARQRTGARQAAASLLIDTYFASLKEQGVAVVEAYAGDDAGR